ncbi:MAG: GAF domain-containing protein, partial [Planctomycetota bacterium]
MTNYEIEDPAHWFNQEQSNRFFDSVVARTGNPDIAREAGRYITSSANLGATKQYVAGLISPTTAYFLMEKIYALFSRGAAISTRKIGSNQVEVTAIPKPGVVEEPYQCANRIGCFESVLTFFADKFAHIDQTSCVHKGDDCCRYIVTWAKTPKMLFNRLRNYLLVFGIVALIILFFILPLIKWGVVALGCMSAILMLSLYAEHLEKKSLTKTIETQKETAYDSILEGNLRYNDALLVQEIGQATSNIFEINQLLRTVAGVMEKRLDFDRGMIMLTDRKQAKLRYFTGYGQSSDEEEILKNTTFRLDNPESKGVFVLALKEQRPFLINNINEIQDSLSRKSIEVAKRLGSQSLICVPIIYEKKPFGILAVDNSKSSRPLRQSDVSLLMGVASQLAISIANTLAFEKLQNSEKKYRELVQTANSIIL